MPIKSETFSGRRRSSNSSEKTLKLRNKIIRMQKDLPNYDKVLRDESKLKRDNDVFR